MHSRCLWFFVLVFLSYPPFLGAQRRVEVRRGDEAAVRLAAYRLGVSEERVRDGRKALGRAMELVDIVAGDQSVASLASAWVGLDRSQAATEIRRIFDRLVHNASRSPGSKYARLTGDANEIVAILQALGDGDALRLMDDWPQPPENSEAVETSRSNARRMQTTRRLMRLAESDPDAAQTLLLEYEQGVPDAELRGPVLWHLANQGRIEQANEMFDEMLRQLPQTGPEGQSGVEMALFYAGQFAPERLPEIIALWSRQLQQTPDGNQLAPDLPDGIELTRVELRALRMMQSLNQTGGRSEPLLEALPGLVAKLESLGGLSGFQRAMNRGRTRDLQQTLDLHREILERPERLLEEQAGSDQELTDRMRQLLGAASSSYQQERYEDGRRTLEVALRLLDRFEQPLVALGMFREIAQIWMQQDGELTQTALSRGWELLEAADKEGPQAAAESEWSRMRGEPASQTIASVEQWLYAAWAWMDYKAASKEILTLDPTAQFAVQTKLLTWLTGARKSITRYFN